MHISTVLNLLYSLFQVRIAQYNELTFVFRYCGAQKFFRRRWTVVSMPTTM